ncbi:MAG: hypothetical protein IPK83_21835 [Planctomycetes bacterium]|nr:hypothetical protein [Planctomycetota bacterium]
MKLRLLIAFAGVALVAAYPMTLSYIKFGNPLESGYPGMYHTRNDQVGQDAKACFWGPRWFERHARAMNLTIPKIDIRETSLFLDHTDQEGGASGSQRRFYWPSF